MNTTAKRFFKYNWQDPIYSRLSVYEKLTYKYIWESCNIAGVFQIHSGIMSACLGFEVDDKLIDSLVDNVEYFERLEGERIWIATYIRYQQGENTACLKTTTPPHKSIVKHLKNAGIFQQAVSLDPELFKHYSSNSLPLAKPNSNSQSKSTSTSTNSIPSSGNGSGHSPIQSISESTNSSYYFCVKIVDKHFDVPVEETHSLVRELNKILQELEGRNMKNPGVYLEKNVEELIRKFGQNDLTIELIKDTLGLDA
jgi:hypothetical protein